MLEPFIPSLIIVLSVTAAFAGGRVIAMVARRVAHSGAFGGVAVGMVSAAFAILFLFNGSSRYALLLPVAFALGFFAGRRPRNAPRVFE